jgi:uncharacterized membrane protein YfcA
MLLGDYLLLCGAALVAGGVNAVAGGGTLLTFPALYAALGATSEVAVVANATSTVALVPGAIAALLGYREEIVHQRRWALMLLGPSLLGGLLGSLLLVWLPSKTFATLVPWLILTAALLFALQPTISRWVGIGTAQPIELKPQTRYSAALFAGMLGFQFLVAVYGGYFGAGIGILMLSALALMGLDDIHQMNAVKTLLNLVINGTSVVVFVASGLVEWRFALAMAASSTAGGYLAARTVRQVNKRLVRLGIVGIGFVLAGYYFYREFMP